MAVSCRGVPSPPLPGVTQPITPLRARAHAAAIVCVSIGVAACVAPRATSASPPTTVPAAGTGATPDVSASSPSLPSLLLPNRTAQLVWAAILTLAVLPIAALSLRAAAWYWALLAGPAAGFFLLIAGPPRTSIGVGWIAMLSVWLAPLLRFAGCAGGDLPRPLAVNGGPPRRTSGSISSSRGPSRRRASARAPGGPPSGNRRRSRPSTASTPIVKVATPSSSCRPASARGSGPSRSYLRGEPLTREMISTALGLFAALNGRNMAYERVFDNIFEMAVGRATTFSPTITSLCRSRRQTQATPGLPELIRPTEQSRPCQIPIEGGCAFHCDGWNRPFMTKVLMPF